MATAAEPLRYRVAILGGGVGAEHLEGWLTLGDRFRVVAICDIDRERAERLAARANRAGGRGTRRNSGTVGASRITGDIASVLADPEVDIVDICLPPALHASVATDALRAGKHVICEKPFAGCLDAADRLAEEARAAGRLLVPVFQYRFGPGIAALRRLQADGLAGTALAGSLETHWDRRAGYYRNSWRGRWDGELGGAVLTHAIHIHDLATGIAGPVTELSAFASTRVNPVETEDCAAICMMTASGTMLTSSITLGASRDRSRLRLIFEGLTAESGTAPYDPGGMGWRFTARATEHQDRVDRLVAESGGVDTVMQRGYAGLFNAVADSLDGLDDGDRCPLPTPSDGVASIELVSAIYQAARSGERVRLPLDRDLPICRTLAPVIPAGDPSGG
ncbi:MAG: Gfo/Idh/MocA family oxidoreductase [Paracoccaceae bacterium]|nr:Gfo/Idh/MocA family oxidoreductase [Paracoccaceae bacterium]